MSKLEEVKEEEMLCPYCLDIEVVEKTGDFEYFCKGCGHFIDKTPKKNIMKPWEN